MRTTASEIKNNTLGIGKKNPLMNQSECFLFCCYC
jgi:hypothetical protein